MQDTFSRCNPLVNLIFYMGTFAFCMIFMHPVCLIMEMLSSFGYYIYLAKKKAFKVLAGLIPLFVLISLINPLFNTRGNTILFFVGERPYTFEALIYGMSVAAMFTSVIIWFFTYNIIITKDKLTYLFGNIMPSVSLVFTMILRFVPQYKKQLNSMKNARRCIGMYSDEKAIKEKLQNGSSLLTGLTSWSLENSVITADSMKSRGYGSMKRSSFAIYRFTIRDGLYLVLMAVCVVITVLCGIMGGMDYTILPDIYIGQNKFTVIGMIFYFIYLSLPLMTDIAEDILWIYLKSKI